MKDETTNTNMQEKAYHLKYFEVLLFCCISEKLEARETGRGHDYFVILKISSNHIRLSVKNSIDLNEEKTLKLLFDVQNKNGKDCNPSFSKSPPGP